MRWQRGRRSLNIEDRRGIGGPAVAAGGGIGGFILVLVAMLLGIDPSFILPQGGPPPAVPPPSVGDQHEALVDFVSVVLADTEDTWKPLFQEIGRPYQEPKLVLFRNQVNSACGLAQAAVGPFYCPADQKVYIDLSFYQELRTRHNAPGDFAQAYVIAHEIGHHVQTLLGISQQVQRAKGRVNQRDANQLSVRQELQADCYAGIWAHHADRARNILEAGDIEEALKAASQIGDDTLQKQAQGYVVPDSFTHGSSAQRVRWFKRGLQTGEMNQCDTFSPPQV
ncbi:KPN_02809 family neutral zinc metallopeptidase [Lyngbya confervoides]|uniref:Zinc metallopeptidase n=1 Tax=Lyngbya confervoides BDU141951 TaxID=1574623 RepID=A0ABD4SZS9_9CYAN|nr:neutral zinc metallopeptidase [Lyngbya confervoides]MCM1981966.1 zinc metallopeptidase [Lyngbya confervoides BDU141951]